MRSNNDGTFLDGDGRPRRLGERPVPRVDVSWPPGEAAQRVAEDVGSRVPAPREDRR